jgi:hypothetical protein
METKDPLDFEKFRQELREQLNKVLIVLETENYKQAEQMKNHLHSFLEAPCLAMNENEFSDYQDSYYDSGCSYE